MKKQLALLILVLALVLSSCVRTPKIPSTKEILLSLTASQKALPAGQLYSTDLEITDRNYLSDTLLISYFGEPNIAKYKESWLSVSIFMPSGSAADEIAVIFCSTPEALIDTARLLSTRLDSVKRLFDDKLPEHKIITHGNYACLLICGDVKTAEKTIKKMC